MRILARITPLRARGLLVAAALILLGCESSDAGECCRVLPGGDPSLIPQPDMSGRQEDVVAQNAQFDCSGLVCVSYQGGPAYCTHLCRDASDCPEGFSCEPLLQSAPPPGGQLGPSDRFCVRALDACFGR